MNIIRAIKSLFKRQRPLASFETPAFDDPAFDINAYMAPFAARLTEHFVNAEADSKKLLKRYGEFTAFSFRIDFDHFLRKEVLLFREPISQYVSFLNEDHWAEKHPFNFPGPFYSGASETCGTGVCQAPDNVLNDADCCEFVFKQPTNYYELLCVLDAAAVEVFDSYSSNGNHHWTYELCREWWGNKAQLLEYLTNEEVVKMNNGQAQLYIDYLNGAAETDLQRYCYFLEYGSFPQQNNIILPKL